MTNEQAIAELQKEHDLIQGEHDLDGSQFAPELLEALAMAIEALKEQNMTLHMNLSEVSAEEIITSPLLTKKWKSKHRRIEP